jgi:ABC-type branched-subunit amino acid transport system substrate-binding protein
MLARLRPLLLGALLLAATSAEAARRRDPDVVEDALAFAMTDRTKAVRVLEQALEGELGEDLRPVQVAAGEQLRLSGEAGRARELFLEVFRATTRGQDYEAARLGLALLDGQESLSEAVLTVLTDTRTEKLVFPTMNADRHLLLALDAARRSDQPALKSEIEAALDAAREDPQVAARVQATLTALGKRPAEGRAEEVLASLSGSGEAGSGEGSTALDRAWAAFERRDEAEARRLAERAAGDAAEGSPEARSARYLLRRLDTTQVASRLVLLLPKGDDKYAAVARQLEEAFRFGYQAEKGSLELVSLDSGVEPDQIIKAMETAVFDKGALALVGPLLSAQTDQAVATAEALHVPLVSLSQTLEDASSLKWTLQAMLTKGDQVEALVKHAMDHLGHDAFVTFAPRSEYGETAARLFKAEVERRGGKVSAERFYDPEAKDLMGDAKALGRKDYSARAEELSRLRREAAQNGGDPGKVVLPPTMDFDAIFLPEAASKVPLAVAALAYEEFPMGDFQPRKDDPKVPVLGLSGWNSQRLVTAGGPYVRSGVFVDALAVPVDGAHWALPSGKSAFVASYRGDYGRTPTALEAVVADAGRLVAVASRARPSDSAAFLQALLDAQSPNAVTGATRFDPSTRRASRELMLLTINKDAIVPAR